MDNVSSGKDVNIPFTVKWTEGSGRAEIEIQGTKLDLKQGDKLKAWDVKTDGVGLVNDDMASHLLFTEPYLLTGGGGPNGASMTPVLLMYKRGIEQGEPDVAAAIGVILVALVLLLAWVTKRLLERDS